MESNDENEAETLSPVEATPDAGAPSCETYLVLTNIAKRHNVRSLLLTAAAFGCCGVFVVGQKHYNFDVDLPRDSNGTVPHQLRNYVKEGKMTIRKFDKWHNLVDHLQSNDICLVGVEIHETAINVDEFRPRSPKVAFLMGNEGAGILPKHMADCQEFVMISQYGGGTASLNVNVACSIVLHRCDAYRREAGQEGSVRK